jgi:tyramine---L-glutamate ligase
VRVFVYEFVTGGGWYSCADKPPPDSLVSEGRAMRDALAADFAAVEGTDVDVLHDARYGEIQLPGVTVHSVDNADAESHAIERLAAEADWTVLIAPEFEGHLLARTLAVERAGGRLLGPSSRVVALCADKHATAGHLAAHGIRVPRGIALEPGAALPADFAYPAVLKPRDGAGSLGIEWIAKLPAGRTVGNDAARLEAFCPGMAVSVACLCGPGEVLPLEPCGQRLAEDFRYLGGWLPLESCLADRARRLAARAVGSLPRGVGYLGVDLVLGDDPSGEGDVAIEINPRLTTSYVGLRALSGVNLAATTIAVAQGREVRLCWELGGIHFNSSGSRVISSVRGNP